MAWSEWKKFGVGITHCGSYTANGSLDITEYGLSNVDIDKFIFVPTKTNSGNKYATTGKAADGYDYVRSYGSYTAHTFTLNDNVLSFTLPRASGKAYCGPNSTSANVSVGGTWTYDVPGDIYYIG